MSRSIVVEGIESGWVWTKGVEGRASRGIVRASCRRRTRESREGREVREEEEERGNEQGRELGLRGS